MPEPLGEGLETSPPERQTQPSTDSAVAVVQGRQRVDAGTMPFVYMLECRDRSFYVGSTWDLERRVSEHQQGVGAAYTSRRRPVRLVWHAAYDSVAEAYSMEKRVQGWSRAKRIALVEGRLGDLPGLSRRGGRPNAG